VHSKPELQLALHNRRDFRFSYSLLNTTKKSQNDRFSASYTWLVNLEMAQFVDLRKCYAPAVSLLSGRPSCCLHSNQHFAIRPARSANAQRVATCVLSQYLRFHLPSECWQVCSATCRKCIIRQRRVRGGPVQSSEGGGKEVYMRTVDCAHHHASNWTEICALSTLGLPVWVWVCKHCFPQTQALAAPICRQWHRLLTDVI
jgi:hypothetical protein